jgi:hypothetical protein
MLTLEQKMERWEDQRAIKNLMGKYANLLILNREGDIYGMLWSASEDVCLGLNDGWYRGQAAVRGYYAACVDRNMLVAKLLRDRFPAQLGGKSDEEIYGIGPMKVKPMYTPVIEVAEDGRTAKGLWSCWGAHNDVESCGPVARWSWGFFAVDFIREDGQWKIWHMQNTNDIDSICGQSWGLPEQSLPEDPAFAELAGFEYPAFTEREVLRAAYSPVRPLTKTPRIPEPYATFGETFSYAEKEA